jgi:hypothetical protein
MDYKERAGFPKGTSPFRFLPVFRLRPHCCFCTLDGH